MSSFVQRMVGAAKLDVPIYEEVEADRTATWQAAGVVVLSSIALGIGEMAHMGIAGLILGTIFALIGWGIWAVLIYLIGAKLLPEDKTDADIGQLLRTLGFAAAPGLLRILAFIPGIGGIIAFLASIWMLVTTVVAVRQALDYESTGRAIIVCLIGWVIQIIFIGGLMALTLGGMEQSAAM